MSSSKATSSSKQQRKPLSEWIHSFQTFGQLFGTKQQPNENDYLIPALRVASSLAHQICKVEETGQSLLPMPSSDWMDSIVVVYEEDHYFFDRKAAAAEKEEEESFDLEKVFNAILTDGEPTTTSNVRAKEDGKGGNNNNIRVEILPPLLVDSSDSTQDATTDGIIFSLGIVFYEIFSGGERPAELIEQQHVGEEPNGSQKSHTGTDPLPVDDYLDGNIIDLGGELGIFDDLQDEYNEIWGNNTNNIDDFLRDQPPKKKESRNKSSITCSVSVDPLRVKGIPGPLCDLIANMLEITNGTLRGEDAYHIMSDVRDDLQLMLDKPAIYLHDQDMGRLSSTGLQFGATMFGRKAELSTIIDAYRRSVSGETELVTISGLSGTGKSFLACEFGKYAVANGGILLSGKFDQLQQGRLFSALASAFNQYCGLLLQNCELASTKQLAHQVNCVLGREACHLTKLIPNLANILGLEMSCTKTDVDEDCINGQKRLQYLLCRFVEVISSSFAAPVTLFLDDLQWADPASIAAVNQLLLPGGQASRKTHFFFLGCYREGEIENCSSLWKASCSSDLLNARCTNVKLDCMDEETLNTMVSETLCLFPRLTRALSSIIYHKTKGNPLFVSRLMLSLRKDGLLHPSLSRRRWEWDKEKILCQKLPDEVAEFLAHSIGVLSSDVKSSLRILSCFGASVDIAFIKTLETVLDRNILDGLDEALAEGLLDKTDDKYCFSHDLIQEATYNMMDSLDQCHFHFSYGMALAPLATGEQDGGILLTAANQFNLAGPEAVQDESQNAFVATLNLRAGKKAMEMSDFVAAYSYFDNGISFLRKMHWEEHYSLSLELFDLAAKCALTNGNILSLKLLSRQVLRKSQSFEDKLNVMYLATCSLASSSKLPDAIEKGLAVLSRLGIELRGCGSSVEACVRETKDLLSAYTDGAILHTRRMTDPTMIMAMKFLRKLVGGMSHIMPKSAPYVTQRIIQLSLDHGMSPESPIGFVHFGSYMAKLGDIRGGYHYVKLARSLLDKVGSRECAGEVICIGTHVVAYVEPLQAALEYHNEGYAAAMASGDVSLAALNNVLSCAGSLFAGVKLQTMREKCAEGIKFSKERKLVIFMMQIQHVQHSVSKLIGTDEEPPKYVSAEEQNILATNTSVMTTYYYQRTYMSFTFRSSDGTKENFEKYLACIGNTWANLFLQHAFHAFYIGLISFWLARQSRDGQQWHERGIKSKLALKQWVQSSQWTFENKWYLLEAEESYCNNDFEAAKTYYGKAISSAKNHKVR
jgi:predicted ATPase